MNLDHLRYFEVLARLQHYGRAAEQLHISQPNLTYAVSQIEQELGVSLFEKSGRRICLTRYGHEFLCTVQQSLDTLDNGIRSVQETGQYGSLVLLGSIRTLGTTLVPSLMRDFQTQTSSNVRFQLHSENGFSSSLLKAVKEKRLDLCFTSFAGDPAHFESFAFCREPFVVITPQGHPLSSRKSVILQDTLPYPQICFSHCAGLRKSVDALFCAINAVPVAAMETEEDAVIAGLVAARTGIAVVPNDPLLQSLPLAILPITSPDPSRMAYLSRRRGLPLPDAAERFWTFCCETLSTQTKSPKAL